MKIALKSDYWQPYDAFFDARNERPFPILDDHVVWERNSAKGNGYGKYEQFEILELLLGYQVVPYWGNFNKIPEDEFPVVGYTDLFSHAGQDKFLIWNKEDYDLSYHQDYLLFSKFIFTNNQKNSFNYSFIKHVFVYGYFFSFKISSPEWLVNLNATEIEFLAKRPEAKEEKENHLKLNLPIYTVDLLVDRNENIYACDLNTAPCLHNLRLDKHDCLGDWKSVSDCVYQFFKDKENK